MKVEHSPQVAERFPGHTTGLLRVVAPAPIAPREGALDELRDRVAAPGGLDRARRSDEDWRETYARMGAKPKYRSSVGVLLEGYERDGAVPAPLPLVELYCWYSLAAGMPMAGYDAAAFAGALRLTIPGKGVPYTPMGQPNAQRQPTRDREVAYVDDEKCVCRYWNQRDCDETKLLPGVRDALFVFDLSEGAGQTRDGAKEIVEAFARLLDADGERAFAALDGVTAVEADLSA